MKRIILLGVAALMAAMMAATASAALAQSGNGATSERSPFTADGVNPCNGEAYHIEGFLHFVSQSNVDSNGQPHTVLHLNQVGVNGQGESGATYLFTATNNLNNKTLDLSAGENTLTLDFRVLRLGQDGTRDDFMVHLTWHVTQDANGEVTANVVDTNIECR